MAKRFENDIREAAQNGFRVLAVATRRKSDEESHMEIAGVLFLGRSS